MKHKLFEQLLNFFKNNILKINKGIDVGGTNTDAVLYEFISNNG